MKCCSRSTFGVVIGCLNILGYIAVTTFAIILISQTDTGSKGEEEQNETALKSTIFVLLIVLCLLMTLVSGLLIMGIVKRRHKLMKPWLTLSVIGFVWNCLRFVIAFIGTLADGSPMSTVFTILFVALIVLGLSALIIWVIYTLYCDIRQENLEKPGAVTRTDGIPYQTQSNDYT